MRRECQWRPDAAGDRLGGTGLGRLHQGCGLEPLDLRLTDVTVTDRSRDGAGSTSHAPRSRFLLYELLFGRVVPRAVELDEPQLTLVRAKDGAISLDLGVADSGEQASTAAQTPLADLLAELARPAGSDPGHSVRMRCSDSFAACASTMRALRWSIGNSASRWRAPHAEIDLTPSAGRRCGRHWHVQSGTR